MTRCVLSGGSFTVLRNKNSAAEKQMSPVAKSMTRALATDFAMPLRTKSITRNPSDFLAEIGLSCGSSNTTSTMWIMV